MTAREALTHAGWRYDAGTDGYRKGDHWVSARQAEVALLGAEQGKQVVPDQGLSETFAAVLVKGGMNDNVV